MTSEHQNAEAIKAAFILIIMFTAVIAIVLLIGALAITVVMVIIVIILIMVTRVASTDIHNGNTRNFRVDISNISNTVNS